MPLLETLGSGSSRAFGLNSFSSKLIAPVVATFNSFGIIDGQTKGTSYSTYSGGSPTGTKSTQYTRMTTTGATQRPGGLSYTDIVLNDDFSYVFFFSRN